MRASDVEWSANRGRVFDRANNGRSDMRSVALGAVLALAFAPFASTAGDGATQITTDPASDGAPAWSPDGSQIAFRLRAQRQLMTSG